MTVNLDQTKFERFKVRLFTADTRARTFVRNARNKTWFFRNNKKNATDIAFCYLFKWRRFDSGYQCAHVALRKPDIVNRFLSTSVLAAALVRVFRDVLSKFTSNIPSRWNVIRRKVKNEKQIDLHVSIRIPLFARAFIKRYDDEKCAQLMSPQQKNKKKTPRCDGIEKCKINIEKKRLLFTVFRCKKSITCRQNMKKKKKKTPKHDFATDFCMHFNIERHENRKINNFLAGSPPNW